MPVSRLCSRTSHELGVTLDDITRAQLIQRIQFLIQYRNHPLGQERLNVVIFKQLVAVRDVKSNGAITLKCDFSHSSKWSQLSSSQTCAFGILKRMQTQQAGTSVHNRDMLLCDVGSRVFYSVASATSPTFDIKFKELYEERLLPVIRELVLTEHQSVHSPQGQLQRNKSNSHSARVDNLVIESITFAANISRSCLGLLLQNMYDTCTTTSAMPILSLWNDDPVVKRQVLRYKSFQSVHTGQPALGDSSALHNAYSKHINANGSSMKMYESNPRNTAESIDAVFRVDDDFYAVTLYKNGTICIPHVPFHTENIGREPNVGESATLGTPHVVDKSHPNSHVNDHNEEPNIRMMRNLVRVVDHLVPCVNQWILSLNTIQ